MGNIHDAVNYALAQQGKPYHAYGNRFGPDYFDCSGLMAASLDHAGIWRPSSASNSSGFYVWGRDAGTLISADEAIHTYGAMLIKGGAYGYGPLGHICFSLGDGRTMEAMGTAYGCRIGSAWNRGFGTSIRVPGAEYRTTEEVIQQAEFQAAMQEIAKCIATIHDHPMHKGDKRGPAVKFVKALLNKKFRAGLDATNVLFGDNMEKAVRAYQASRRLHVDGVVGAKTIDALVR